MVSADEMFLKNVVQFSRLLLYYNVTRFVRCWLLGSRLNARSNASDKYATFSSSFFLLFPYFVKSTQIIHREDNDDNQRNYTGPTIGRIKHDNEISLKRRRTFRSFPLIAFEC